MIKEEYTLIQIMPAEGWFARFENSKENEENGHFRYEKLLVFGLFEDRNNNRYVDGITECSMSGPVSEEYDYVSIVYRPDKTEQTFSDDKVYCFPEAP